MRTIILWMLISYFIGSIPTGWLITKLFHKDENGKRDNLDIRTFGSGNIGAANVKRAMGIGWAVFVAFVDIFKGAFALLLVAGVGSYEDPGLLAALSAFAAVIGHNYTCWLKFKGGKGVATTYGTLFFLWPYKSFAIVLLCGAIWYAVMKITRYVSLASMLSLIAMPLFFWMLDAPKEFTIVAGVLAVLCVYRHKSNISRLMAGNENRLK